MSGYDFSDLPGYEDAATDARRERECLRAQRDPDYTPRFARPTPPLPAESEPA